MQRQLIVMRHAKSAWSTGALNDHARPLNRRGRADAPRVADALMSVDWAPQVVLSSDSARTQETWARMADRLPPAEVTFTRDLYHAGVLALCTAVGRLPDQQSRVLVLGHNPGWEDAVKWLTGHRVSLTTANAVLLSANGSTWTDVLRSGAWTIETVFRPKELF